MTTRPPTLSAVRTLPTRAPFLTPTMLTHVSSAIAITPASFAVVGRQRHEGAQVDREGRRERRDRAGRRDREEHPAAEKPREPSETARDEGVDASRLGHRGPELGERERAEQGQHAADHPHREHPSRLVDGARDLGGNEKDPGADDRPDDEVDGVEEREVAAELRHG